VAEALGLAVEWEPGTVKLGPGEATAAATEAPADCPASRVEKALGITVVRGPVSSPFGPGLGVLAVDAGGRAAELGLQPQDVILACGDTPISCPRDLDAVIAKQQAEKQCVCKLTVARGQTKLTLQGSPKAQP
jgi:S1-C subfamily serine protease